MYASVVSGHYIIAFYDARSKRLVNQLLLRCNGKRSKLNVCNYIRKGYIELFAINVLLKRLQTDTPGNEN